MNDTERKPLQPVTTEDVARKYTAMLERVRRAAGDMNARIEKLSGEYDIPIPPESPERSS